ncbi:hypothetical protein ACFVVM_24565 [Nocardia sp. NPDC058176]|uniref:hypothetical protein n=1 Tax=Nocardia sp. NPDC058176 TaxID=3346368 RepID=UPI0036D92146
MVAYGPLLTHTRIRWWLLATVATRLAVCTVPLAVVFAAKAHTGSYAWGAVLAGAYAAGEAIGAPVMGARFQRRPLRRELALVSVVEAVALVGVVRALSMGLPVVAALLAAVGGGVASGTFGGLRTLLVNTVPESGHSALALDTIVNQVCQVAGPALAAAVAVSWTPDAPLLIVSGGLLFAVAAAARLPDTLAAEDSGSPPAEKVPTMTIVGLIWPALVVVTVILMIEAVLEVTLPSILEQRDGPPLWAGLALSGLAVASIAGSFTYGLRRWPGHPETHTLIFAGLFTVVAVATGLAHSPAATVALVALAGLFQAPANTARGLAVMDALPPHAWSVGFSLLYSCGAVGFTLASAVAALFLVTDSAAIMLIVLGTAGFVIFAGIGWWEGAARRRSRPT